MMISVQMMKADLPILKNKLKRNFLEWHISPNVFTINVCFWEPIFCYERIREQGLILCCLLVISKCKNQHEYTVLRLIKY